MHPSLLTLGLWLLLLINCQLSASNAQSIGNGTVTMTTKSEPPSSFYTLPQLPPEPMLRMLRPTYTRTELKVGRSLEPEKVQKLNVRSNNGRMVEIIVKKRDDKSGHPRDMSQGSSSSSSSSNSKPSNPQGYRVASDNNPESVDIINAFLEHVNRVERPARYYEDESSIKNDRRPVRIAVSSRPVDPVVATKVPSPVLISSDAIFMKDNPSLKTQKKPRAMPEIGEDGIPVVHGIRVPDDEADKRQTWRNARVINGELVPYEKGYIPKKMENTEDSYGQLIFAVPSSESNHRQRSIGPFTTADNFPNDESSKGFGPFSVEDNLRSGVRVGGAEPVRMPSNFGPFSRADNGRVSNAKLLEYIRRINDQESKKHYYAARTPNKEIFAEQPKIQRRMLQNPGNPVYPVSKLYSVPGSNQINSEIEDARKPVLQYAHPELGVQPAKPVPPQNKPSSKSSKKVINVEISKHNDHSPFAIEPAMLGKDYYESQPTMKHPIKNPYEELYQPVKIPATYPYTYGFIRRVKPERPFWLKITEQVKDSFQSGINSMQQFARPVLDPLVEAGQKISKNLGFIPRPNEAKDKADLVVASGTNSIVLPALGMLAGGAALGLGAVAVGRIFDMDLLRRSGEQLVFELDDMEHKRTMEGIETHPEKYFLVVPSTAITHMEPVEHTEGSKRSKRSADMSGLDDNFQDSDIFRNDKFDDQGDVIEIIDMKSPEIYDEVSGEDIQSIDNNGALRNRRKRAIGAAYDDESFGQTLQDVERDIPRPSRVGFEQQLKQTNWRNPSCAKRTFCLVMVQQDADDVVLMEKKMHTMLEMMHPTLGASLTDHLSEVTDAIRQHDCARFVCYEQRT